MQGRIKVVHVVESYGGGVATAVEQYIRSSISHEHHLVKADRKSAEIAQYLTSFQAVHALPKQLVLAAHMLKALDRKCNFDVVHAHSSWAGLICRVAFNGQRRNVVYTPHCFAFERQDIGPLMRWAIWQVEKSLAFRHTVVAACSEHEQRLALELGSRDAVWVPSVASTTAGSVRQTTSIGFVGRVTAQKDPQFAADCAQLLAPHPLVWLGGGQPSQTQLLEAAGITVSGWAPHHTTMQDLKSLKVYLHSAAWEGFPMTILEAAAAGVPIVARRLPCFEQLGLTDQLVETPRQMAAVARSLLIDPEAREANVVAWRRALRHNNRRAQSRALARVYQGEA